jgi:hypothetical protein
MNNFASTFHLLGRYPDLARNRDFLSWHRLNGGDVWHETLANEKGQITVVVQSESRLNLFAALLQADYGEAREGTKEARVLRTANIDLVEDGFLPELAVGLIRRETGAANEEIHAIRPVVDLQGEQPKLSWEIEVKDDRTIQVFRADSPSDFERLTAIELKKTEPAKPMDDLVPPTSDWLADNELHHPSRQEWRSLALQITSGAATVADKAFRIWLDIQSRMAYDLNITHIAEFTWSDNLTRNQNGWRGICDEWAIVEATLLRALGIPAVIKFLTWTQPNGKTVAHACVEWSDNGAWRHMDALWRAFDNRAVYRQNGATNVKVMDADFPLDSRSTVPAWGVPDPTGDERLHPYGDFILNPGYPGNMRPGYSS